MPQTTCKNKKNPLDIKLFNCENLAKKYVKKDRFDSKEFRAYVSP